MKNLFCIVVLSVSLWGQGILQPIFMKQPGGAAPPPTPAVSLVASYANTGACTNTTYCDTASFTPAVGDLLVVFIDATGTVLATPVVTDSTGDITGFTKITSTTQASGNTLYAYIANSFATNTTSRTIHYNFTGDATTGQNVDVYKVTNMQVAGLSAVRQYKSQASQTAGGTPGITFDNAADTLDPILGALADGINNATEVTHPAGWTEGNDQQFSTPSQHMGTIYRNSGFTGTAVTWAATDANAFGDIVLELNNAAATPTFSADTKSFPQTVTISDATSGASSYIHYTTCTTASCTPSDPTDASTQGYSLSVTDPTTIKAGVFDMTGYRNSAIGTATYTSTGGPPEDIGNTSGSAGSNSLANINVWYGIKVHTNANGAGYSVNSCTVYMGAYAGSGDGYRCAIYDDSAKTTPLCASAEALTTGSAGAATISLTTPCTSVTLAASHDYWLVFNNNFSDIPYQTYTSGIDGYYISQTYSSTGTPGSFATPSGPTGEYLHMYLTVTPK